MRIAHDFHPAVTPTGVRDVITNQPDGTRDVHITSEIGTTGYAMGEMVAGI